MNKVFFTNGGADANENAVRMARIHTGKQKVLVVLPLVPRQHRRRDPGDGRPAPLAERVRRRTSVHFFGPYPYRSSFWSTTAEQESERALQHLEQVIEFEGPAPSPRS